MKISLNALKKYVDINIPTEQLIQLIGARLVEVESVEDFSQKYQNIKIVRVITCEAIPDTHLHLCQIDTGADKVQVVCGAPNVHTGMLAVWLAPGCILPSTFGGENLKLDVRKLRGYESHGMLAAVDELGFSAEHNTIIEIAPDFAKPGDDFAELFDLNDIILDIENKSLTHRPDCFGIIGFAREVAGILGQKFTEPEFLTRESVFPDGFFQETATGLISHDCPISVEIPDSSLCPRYSAAIIEINLASANSFLTKGKMFLYKFGMRPVSDLVDITNIIMLTTGQPLHAFDYDKFLAVDSAQKIIVRAAKKGESLTLLDGKTITCDENDILTTNNNTPVALAGAMGGQNTAIDSSTKRILLESATFSLYHLRKTQMAHGLFSEAITRFTKGQPPAQTYPALAEASRQINGQILSAIDFYPNPEPNPAITITTSEINSLLGTNYSTAEIVKALDNVNFDIGQPFPDQLLIRALGWRTDIKIKEDVIEEVGRLLGYDNIKIDYPTRPFIGAKISPMLKLKTTLRNLLSDRFAAHEVLTYSFVSKKLLQDVGQNPADHYEIANSISPDLQCFRSKITPSLISKIRENLKSGHSDFSLYEINQVSAKNFGLTPDQTPLTKNHLAITTFGDYYSIKSTITALFSALGTDFNIKPFNDPTSPYIEPLHAANLYLGDQFIGSMGEVRASVLSKFKLSPNIAVAEIDLEALINQPTSTTRPIRLSRFPSVSRDITIKSAANLPHSDLLSALTSVPEAQNLIFKVSPVSIYQPESSSSTKNTSFRLIFSSPEKTLSSSEISAIIDQITANIHALSAEII